jgi:hypothetical protein
VIVQGQELEAIAEALAVADNRTNLDGLGCKGERDIESHDFAGFETAGEGGADAVLTHLGGASPTAAEFSGLKHFDLQADIDGEAWKAASVLSLRAMAGGGLSARLCGGCYADFVVGAHFR